MTESETQCCIAGGGPAGIMLGYLLARAGLRVVVLEKHADFLRDFRGDTLHASTLELLDELGLGGALERLPHEVVTHLIARFGRERVTVADFSVLGGRHKHIYLMPQWDFLNWMAEEASRFPGFELRMGTAAVALVEEDGVVRGVVAETSGRRSTLRAALTVACDGRSSTLRAASGLVPKDLGAPMDVLWFRVPHVPADGNETGGSVAPGALLALLARDGYWQVAYVIPKGGHDAVRARGLVAFRAAVAALFPPFGDGRLGALRSWDDVKLLTVQVNRLRTWFRPGLLFLGDAAHAMSPIGGVGINLAIQDAVAAARLLAEPLRRGDVREAHLFAVQARRWAPTVLTQRMQRTLQNRVLSPLLASAPKSRSADGRPPRWLAPVLGSAPVRRAIARGIARGVLPEHAPRALFG